ncbi:MAG: threonine ammonia-lyase [Oscillospiraceae bacterium]|nr:threonine ammonia-lyase [Oscillospiraceae bacterium]MBQ3803950.1 threonine ammonia-lyase [Oscillospiraceae bacterium]MBR2703322.1 threonine ammonia-lyase [Oscillospiraceae bacterium]MBR2799977.1 threonine ammonia-lyase [Oscillospiraceae bacterium]MBR2808174.1 threonine ammonia-lyase [Oscillospiraceae bacterium]
MDNSVTLKMIQEAREALKGIAEVTPIVTSTRLGKNLFIKSENLQKTGSFKIRGAYNKIRMLSPEEAKRGVIACSAGNHAQGVALSATRLGIRSVICMPEGAPILKVEATRGYGAEVVLVPGIYDDAAREAKRLADEEGFTFAHPFNDPYVIAGQGTIGLEILEQVPDVEQIVVPIGGGGLISGVAAAVKSMRPNVKVIGVQAATVPSMFVSMRSGEIITVRDGATIADGIHVLTPGDLTFRMVKDYVDDIVTVSEDEIAAAIVALLEGPKTVAEGAGATSVAAYLFNRVDTSLNTVALVSGGNVDITTLSRIITKGMQKTGRIVRLTTKLIDKAGNLAQLVACVAECGANILDIEHEREDAKTEVNSCVVTMTLETRDEAHIRKIRESLVSHGYRLIE